MWKLNLDGNFSPNTIVCHRHFSVAQLALSGRGDEARGREGGRKRERERERWRERRAASPRQNSQHRLASLHMRTREHAGEARPLRHMMALALTGICLIMHRQRVLDWRERSKPFTFKLEPNAQTFPWSVHTSEWDPPALTCTIVIPASLSTTCACGALSCE